MKKKTTSTKLNEQQLKDAIADHKKTFDERIAPFIKKRNLKTFSTQGKWTSANMLHLCNDY